MPEKECPMCGTTMRLRQTEDVVQIPGHAKPTAHPVKEWVCPECDYFEEADEKNS